MKYLKRIFESIEKGWSKSKVKEYLYGDCDQELEKLELKVKNLKQFKDNLDSDFSELDFNIRSNFSDQPGFSHYYFDSPGHSSQYVKCSLKVVFNTDDISHKERRTIIRDFLTDCSHLIGLKVDDSVDFYEGKDWLSEVGWRYVTYISSPVLPKDDDDDYPDDYQ